MLGPSAPRYVLSKFYKWAAHFNPFHLSIEHIDGDKNVYADLLTRWTRGHRRNQRARGSVLALYRSFITERL